MIRLYTNMKETNLICIGCPMGCNLLVKQDNLEIIVSGNNCPKGEKYAKNEITSPKRSVTTTVKLINGEDNVISVKTQTDIPKEKILDVINELKSISVCAPIKINDIIVKNICNTGVDIIATSNAK